MPQRRSYRKRQESSGSEREGEGEGVQDEAVRDKLEEAREMQSFRKKKSGVSAVGLAFGAKFAEDEKLVADPFKLKTGGGLVDLKDIKPSEFDGAEDEVLQRLSSTFSAETKQRDDETHMLRYIEDEMSKRAPAVTPEKQISEHEAKINALYKVPERLDVKSKSSTEEMLSNQMLSGIPEVDLGLEAKFKNIEETELAKQKISLGQKDRKDKPSMAPTNVATNYSLHSLRFYKERRPRKPDQNEGGVAGEEEGGKEQAPAYIPVVGENEPELKPASATADSQKRKLEHNQQATDDFHYDKYRKRSRRF